MDTSRKNISRLDFIKGTLSSLGFGALGGGRLFAAPPDWTPPAHPNLILGVMSDTHLRTGNDGARMASHWNDSHFAAALKYFRRQNVDAVVHCGDFAHRAQVKAMEFHAETWNRIFPDNHAPDGHTVEKLFVDGYHDIVGNKFGGEFRVEKIHTDPAELAKNLLGTDMAGHWRRIWGEPFQEVWHKEVKGHHFFGRQCNADMAKFAKLVAEIDEKEKFSAGTRPFFMLSHTRLPTIKSLRPYRNAVAFFGHLHQSASNWNTIYFAKGLPFPQIQVPPCEPRGSGALCGDEYISSAKLEGQESVGRCYQGFVVRVYDDMLVISRREFGRGGSLGPDWLMPLGQYEPHPFAKGELKKCIGEPQFRPDAKLVLDAGETQFVAIDADAISSIPRVIREHSSPLPLKLSIPLANGNPKSRVYAYDVEINGEGAHSSFALHRAVYAAGCNLGIGREPNGGDTVLLFRKGELPQGGRYTFKVTPLSSLGTRGSPISATIEVT